MIYITTNHGTGDTYMTLAFAKAVERLRGQHVTVLIPPQHDAIAKMFPDVTVSHGDPGIINFLNNMDDVLIVAHPSAVPKRVRIDHLCLLARPLCHADLWRAMLELPADEPMPRGQYDNKVTRLPKSALLIPQANSIPNCVPEFWMLLQDRLEREGWDVTVNDRSWPLERLFQACDDAEWVIGPQCGVMMILCHTGFPCRKTIATPSLDGHHYFKKTYPYMYVETFAGENYGDVDEVKITDNLDWAISSVMAGANAHRISRPQRASGIAVMLSYGDFFDRAAILTVKSIRLPPEKAALIMRDHLRHSELLTSVIGHDPLLKDLARKLFEVNDEAFQQNEVAVKTVMEGGQASEHYAKAVHLNKQRTELKEKVNRQCNSIYVEVKSYYG